MSLLRRSNDSLLDSSSVEHSSYPAALRLVGSGATAVVKGTGGIGYLAARDGYELAKRGVARARSSADDLATALDTDKIPGATPKRKSRRPWIVAGVVVAVLAGGAVFSASRRRHAAPPAGEPPRLGEPATNGSTSPRHAADEVSPPR